jgi:YegS/Rv2252/BmrU family lipid kinase
VDEAIFAVFNPQSGKGRGAAFVAPVLQALGSRARVEHALTRGPGDEARLAREAVARGFRRIVAVGGDGTWSNVGNAILSTGAPARLGLVPGGTGCDFAKTVGVPPRDLHAACRVILDGHVRTVDVGRIEGRHFLNIAGFGYDVAVLEDSWSVSYLEGSALYLYCALRQLGSYRGFPVELSADGGPFERRDMLMLIVANARVFGGGFQVAPAADLEDGRLDSVSFANMGFARRVGALVRLLRGTHLAHPRVASVRAQRLVCRFAAPPAYETDGEWNQARAAEVVIEVAPKALQVMAPAP